MRRLLAGLLTSSLLACAPEPVPGRLATQQVLSVHLFVGRPFRAVPEPDPFIQAALVGFTEEVVRSGYDWAGQTLDPDGEEAVLEELARHNAEAPGVAGVYLVFIEAPSLVGFGPAFTRVDCTVFGPEGGVLLRTELEPPTRRPLMDMLLPRTQPDVDGRYWAARAWASAPGRVLPQRG